MHQLNLIKLYVKYSVKLNVKFFAKFYNLAIRYSK